MLILLFLGLHANSSMRACVCDTWLKRNGNIPSLRYASMHHLLSPSVYCPTLHSTPHRLIQKRNAYTRCRQNVISLVFGPSSSTHSHHMFGSRLAFALCRSCQTTCSSTPTHFCWRWCMLIVSVDGMVRKETRSYQLLSFLICKYLIIYSL